MASYLDSVVGGLHSAFLTTDINNGGTFVATSLNETVADVISRKQAQTFNKNLKPGSHVTVWNFFTKYKAILIFIAVLFLLTMGLIIIRLLYHKKNKYEVEEQLAARFI